MFESLRGLTPHTNIISISEKANPNYLAKIVKLTEQLDKGEEDLESAN